MVPTRLDLQRESVMYEFLQETVANNMTTPVRSITPETTVGDLYRFFAADDFDAYPVVQDGMLVGIVSKLDALEVFAFTEDRILPRYADGMATQVNKIMSSDVV